MRNLGHEYHEQIGPRGTGVRVLDYLAAGYVHSSRGEWKRRIDRGLVEVDGRRVTPDTPLRSGQRLVWRRPPWVEAAVPTGFSVLYQDGDLLAVAKPAGLPCQPGGGFQDGTLLYLARRRWPEASLAHRLGRGTSGIVLLARTGRARRALAAAFRRQEPRRLYRALIQGSPDRDTFAVTAPIGPVPHPVLGTVHGAAPDGKPSRTEATVLERRSDGSSLVSLRLHTGRPHQIRIHLAAAGHPLLGDPLYGPGGAPVSGALPGQGEYLLHAARLGVPHPDGSRWLEISCAPPARLRRRDENVEKVLSA